MAKHETMWVYLSKLRNSGISYKFLEKSRLLGKWQRWQGGRGNRHTRVASCIAVD